MRAEYKRDMNHNYLILHQEEPIDTASYQVRMLVGNGIPSILKCHVQGIDGECVIYYDITSRQSLTVLFEEKKLTFADLQLIFGGFVQVMEEMSEYLLNPGYLILRPEYMYVDVEKKSMFFCYLPGCEAEVRGQFQSLTEYILPRLDHEDPQAVMLGYSVYRRALEDCFHLEHIKEELYREIKNESVISKDEKQQPQWQNDLLDDTQMKEAESEEEQQQGDWLEEGFAADAQAGKALSGGKIFPWKRIIGCLAGALAGMAVLGAKLLGYLPDVPLEAVLGIVLALMGGGMLGTWLYEKKKAAGAKRTTGEAYVMRKGQSRNPEDLDKESEEEDFWSEDKHQNISKANTAGAENTISKEKQSSRGLRKINTQADDFGETVVLSAGNLIGPSTLVSREPGELATIYLKEDLTVIGKLEVAVDAVINLPTVSRMHAKIRKRDGEYYLTDLNSRNGTSVNGQMLCANQDYCLQDQDEVDFAQARYIFLKTS